ncbi:hypothetical protein AQI88_01415 [Streptomyces cellostaticus]|uniref:Uncharacterized protein n=1 Tax=Streptomyces cellostaticus TaxID=67285 RepID=A0A117PYF2_9ACTN|nr:hypothetical protein AQI88_01415 [Streptomyces cellostaticus]GHI03247.1 hypothetical protein Scel_15680 [Streptomyces cellostaticus]
MLFSPAGGGRYATPARQFAQVAEDMVFIAENGTYVVRDGVELSSHLLAADLARTVRRPGTDGVDAGTVVCGK